MLTQKQKNEIYECAVILVETRNEWYSCLALCEAFKGVRVDVPLVVGSNSPR
jgi:hypothetical protein